MAKRNKPKWTIMVYLAGDNNLTTNCISVLQQLENVKYVGDEVCVLACFDSNTPAPKGSRYLAINCTLNQTHNGFDWEIHNDLISPQERGKGHTIIAPDFCSLDSSYNGQSDAFTGVSVAAGLKRFIEWAVKRHDESEHYMLILYGHGPVVAGQTFLAKENPPSSLRLEDIRSVLEPHFGRGKPKIDILACQNCVMNGVETAYELKDHVDYMIGSQGLVLAYGWPYEKMISGVVENANAGTHDIARHLLKACARHMLDFVVMDRSSEQSLCDLRFLRDSSSLTDAIKELGNELKTGLEFHLENDKLVLRYPSICNAVKLARLEAQSYWGETFVDLYDFCERLLKRCDDVATINTAVLNDMGLREAAARFKETELAKQLGRIISWCVTIQKEIKRMVSESFYIGSELQYSHGLSIYFPWTLPGAPYFFTSKGSGDTDYSLKTAFEAYCGYTFVEASRWTSFLEAFFRATLRNVRRAERDFTVQPTNTLDQGFVANINSPSEVFAIDLQKSSSDTGRINPEVWSNVKNYPRRNYLSPADCPRKLDQAGTHMKGQGRFSNTLSPPVSYLGWNITGLVLETIKRDPASAGNGNVSGSGAATTTENETTMAPRKVA